MSNKRRRSRPNATGRNEVFQYFNVPFAMVQSAAFRSLNPSSVKVWVELRTRFIGTNNGKVVLSMSDASRTIGLGKATLGRAFHELQEKGFIICTRAGNWYGRIATEWELTDLPLNGQSPKRLWQQWQPDKSSVPNRNQKTRVGSKSEP